MHGDVCRCVSYVRVCVCGYLQDRALSSTRSRENKLQPTTFKDSAWVFCTHGSVLAPHTSACTCRPHQGADVNLFLMSAQSSGSLRCATACRVLLFHDEDFAAQLAALLLLLCHRTLQERGLLLPFYHGYVATNTNIVDKNRERKRRSTCHGDRWQMKTLIPVMSHNFEQ